MHEKVAAFEHKLKEFFDRHDPAKTNLAHTIAHRFVNHQEEVFEHLSEVYHKKEHIEVTEGDIFGFDIGPSTMGGG